ncbi:type II secretion system F family protein [Companilactobacillus alimentarius]|uniref:Competence protein ComG n=1 Tax=Companilactobacillus alimentarius DSM 20249 TaxID=1423720 RepID=A0A2K9HE06_9LACO|nr:type II secretion system F family protein [Companilactobacillus alimentarius]AUI70779.1 competence protein ComG [Companilactobacillus alimentarius DSM 20249]GEO45268.1 competence protein ComG [Companilactobacillus alimentarius]
MKKLIKNIFPKKITNGKKSEHLLTISKLLKNGFSLSDAINCLRLLDDDQRIFFKIYQDLCQGKMISQALLHLDLPTVISNQLIIAQNHGKLAQALEQTGQLIQSQVKQKNKLKELLIYPCFILSFLIVMLVAMKVYIVPQLAISDSGKMIDLFLGAILGVILSVFVASLLFIAFLKRKDEYKRAIILVKLPIVGKIYLNFLQFLILQGWGMQLANGMNLFDICEVSKQFQVGSVQRHLAEKFTNDLVRGKSFVDLIKQEPLLPKQLLVIFQAGESGTALAQDLLVMSELKFDETQRGLKKMLGLIQPILFGVIAIVIVVTYLIVLLPTYGMMKGIS